jgi:hypothetical protein
VRGGVGSQVFVVGVSEAGFTKLGEMAAADLPTQAVEPESAFAKAMARALSRGGGA